MLVLSYRQPFVLAQEVASLDHLGGGRLLLGVGVGWMRCGNSAAAFRRVARLGDGWVGVDLDSGETEVATAAIIHEATRRGQRREELWLAERGAVVASE